MYYFFKNSDFQLDKFEFDVDYFPRITKNEHIFLKKLIENIDDSSEFFKIKIKKTDFEKDEINKIIISFAKKVIHCRIKEEIEETELYFNFFDFIMLTGDEVVYKFSQEILKSSTQGNFFARINLLGYLKLKHDYSRELYKTILKFNLIQNSVEYDINEFKKILKINSENYNRYYNFESKILNSLVKDFETAGIIVWFDKIKNNNAKTGKILKIKVNYKNINAINFHKEINEIIKKYRDFIADFTKAYDIIYNFRKTNSKKATLEFFDKNYLEIFKEED